MLITADWVVPISHAPIADGGVVVRGSHVAAIGKAADLKKSHPDEQVHELEGCIVMPGLVNAHTHLVLTFMRGLIPSQPFHEWIKRIPVAMNALNRDDLAASISLGAMRSILGGVTAVGDIAYGPESVAIAADTGLGGAFFWEVLGLTAEELAGALDDVEFPSDPAMGCSGRFRCGLSPHSPYTSGPALIQATHRMASAQGAGFAIHVAESAAETELLQHGTGPLSGLASRLAHGYLAPGKGTISYLDSLGVLEDAVLIHAVNVLPVEMPRLARSSAGVVLCPRSNAYLHNGSAPVWRLHNSGVPIALGTDSLASNSDLDLFEEARALRELEPRLSAEVVVRMMTEGGAAVLGLGPTFGTLEPGTEADLAAYRAEPTSDPYGALLESAGRHNVEAVMSAGVWRVLGGAPTFGVSTIERGSQLASQKAELALAFDDPSGF